MRLFAALMLLSTAPALAEPAPHVAAFSFDQLKQPLPLPYDETGDAKAAIAKARAVAIRQHKLLLVDFGGNWCADCRILAGTMELPEVKAFVDRHYVVTSVDVGRFDKNLDILQAYGLPPRPKGVPALLVIEPRGNKVVNAGHETALEDARHLSPQALADWLASWPK